MPFVSVCEVVKGHVKNRNVTFKKSSVNKDVVSFINCLNCCQRKKGKKKTQKENAAETCVLHCAAHFYKLICLWTWRKNDKAQNILQGPCQARLHTGLPVHPGLVTKNNLLKHWPVRNASRRQRWSWLGPDEPICLSALRRPAGTLPCVREDKVGDPCPTAPACLHFPWRCMTVCVFHRGYRCAPASTCETQDIKKGWWDCEL